MHRLGFTLIEFIACLAMIALAAGAAALSLRGRSEEAALAQAMDRLGHADHLVREGSQRWDRSFQLVIDLDGDTVQVQGGGAEGAQNSTIDLPHEVRIERAWVGRRAADHGQMTIPCSTRGQMPSYAVLLSSAGRKRGWLLVAGMTGEIERLDDERQVENILQLCEPARPDAD